MDNSTAGRGNGAQQVVPEVQSLMEHFKKALQQLDMEAAVVAKLSDPKTREIRDSGRRKNQIALDRRRQRERIAAVHMYFRGFLKSSSSTPFFRHIFPGVLRLDHNTSSTYLPTTQHHLSTIFSPHEYL